MAGPAQPAGAGKGAQARQEAPGRLTFGPGRGTRRSQPPSCYPSSNLCGRSCEAGVPVQRGRGGVKMVACKMNHRAFEAGGFFV